MGCDCSKRAVIDAMGKSVKNYYEIFTPYNAASTTAGKTIVAGPIAIPDAFEMCGGSGVIRSLTIKEFATSQKLSLDVIFCGNDGHAVAENAVTAFDATVAADIFLQPTVTVDTSDYVDKGDYQEVQHDFKNPFSVFNAASAEGDKRKVWFYLVARAVKTFTSSTRLVVEIAIESD